MNEEVLRICPEDYYGYGYEEQRSSRDSEERICFFRYIDGSLYYIGVVESYKAHQCKVTGKVVVSDSNPIFKPYSGKEQVDYVTGRFNSKEEAKLYSNHYIQVLRPYLNKRIPTKTDYGVYNQYMFTDSSFRYNTGLPLLVNLLSTVYDTDTIYKSLKFKLDKTVIEDIIDRVGEYHCTLQPYEYITVCGKIKTDRNMLRHYKKRYNEHFIECEKIYMRVCGI